LQDKVVTQAKPPIQPESDLKLIWIAPGSFTLGSPGTERGHRLGEGPQTVVMLDQGYWLAETAVTVAQYTNFEGRVPKMHGELNKNSNQPVVGVSWSQAVDYCRVLNEREAGAGRLPSGYIYRLPTEAEREFACRAGTATYFSFGDDIGEFQLKTNEWYKANSEGSPHPVRTKQPNPWGLYDMQGNTAEWCLDWLERYPGGEVTNLVGTLNGRFHVLRGGAWSYSSDQCRCAARHQGMDSIRVMEAGFRIALAPEIKLP
jgi:formylglycine-generating enzyme required for sulfatase activity